MAEMHKRYSKADFVSKIIQFAIDKKPSLQAAAGGGLEEEGPCQILTIILVFWVLILFS